MLKKKPIKVVFEKKLNLSKLWIYIWYLIHIKTRLWICSRR